MISNVIVKELPRAPMDGLKFEMCEHKGIGHPDTIADAVCEAASRELSLAYRGRCGRILHHNLDKGLLIAGSNVPHFGGGAIIEPMKIIVCGRATTLGGKIDVHEIAATAARR